MAKLKPTIEPKAPAPAEPIRPPFLPWPNSPKDLGSMPRVFRIHRMNSFEWQAFVTADGREELIGKPDTFDLVMYRIQAVMRAEGQAQFLAAKNKAEARLGK